MFQVTPLSVCSHHLRLSIGQANSSPSHLGPVNIKSDLLTCLVAFLLFSNRFDSNSWITYCMSYHICFCWITYECKVWFTWFINFARVLAEISPRRRTETSLGAMRDFEASKFWLLFLSLFWLVFLSLFGLVVPSNTWLSCVCKSVKCYKFLHTFNDTTSYGDGVAFA